MLNSDELSDEQIAQVMNPERLNNLLQQADNFCFINSDEFDDYLENSTNYNTIAAIQPNTNNGKL